MQFCSTPRTLWMLANLDREVMGSPEVAILECKTAGLNGARLWKEGVPDYVSICRSCTSWLLRESKPLMLLC